MRSGRRCANPSLGRRSTPPKAWQFRIRDILDSIEAAESHVEGMTDQEFTADRKTIDAVIRVLTVIGEAAANVPPSIQERFPDVPWDEMRRMRNVVVHVYFGVDLAIIWRTIQEDLPPLKAQLNDALRDAEGDK